MSAMFAVNHCAAQLKPSNAGMAGSPSAAASTQMCSV